ncbi:BrnT family toxin [Sphingorhabdus sp.]|uniref:BrnT family toxin n=1 Tax=Sphingorhabdus sp. TaxID=1902408 RepID=UPI0037C83FB8
MKIEFDAEKDATNIARHGVALALGAKIFDDHELLIVPTIREQDREERYKAIGLIGDKLWTAIHVYRGDVVRFLSVRRSNTSEQRSYHSYSS